MADTAVEKKDTPVSTPEKKDVEKTPVEIVDDDSKTSENGEEKTTENGTSEEKSEDVKDGAENGDAKEDVCCIKRKSGGGDATEIAKDGVTPEKKAKLDDIPTEESNGETEATA